MASKRKQDEKHLNILRGMVKLEFNKQCFECSQKGPTYVDMTIGSYVCTTCSGLLRGLNPPHRVKSISMATFTPDEIDYLKCRGNHFNQKVWLGLHNRSHYDFDSKDENKIRDFMAQKYEKKRYYVAPTEHMHEEARKFNTPATPDPTTRPLRSIGNVPKLASQNNIIVHQTHSAANGRPKQPPPIQVPQQTPQQAPQQPAPQATQPRFDLLSDLGGDPFQPSQKPVNAAESGGFADFSAFGGGGGGMPANQPAAVAFPAQQQAPAHPTAFPPPGGILTPMNTAAQQPTSSTGNQQFAAFPANSAPPGGGGDKYSALADLDSAFSQPAPTAPVSVNWNSGGAGTGGGPINWGGGAPVQSSSTFGTASSTSSQSGGFNAVSNPFGTSPPVQSISQQIPGANPFAVPSSYGTSPVGQSGIPGLGNQSGFMPTQQSASASGFGSQTSSSGFVQSPVSGGAIFGSAAASSTQMTSQHQAGGGFANFGGLSNGGASQPGGWGNPQPAAVQGQFAAFPAAQGGGFGQPQKPTGFPQQAQAGAQFGGGWGVPSQPAAANPFMNIANQAPPPRATNSTNPFL